VKEKFCLCKTAINIWKRTENLSAHRWNIPAFHKLNCSLMEKHEEEEREKTAN
jgi:hypothetical protein